MCVKVSGKPDRGFQLQKITRLTTSKTPSKIRNGATLERNRSRQQTETEPNNQQVRDSDGDDDVDSLGRPPPNEPGETKYFRQVNKSQQSWTQSTAKRNVTEVMLKHPKNTNLLVPRLPFQRYVIEPFQKHQLFLLSILFRFHDFFPISAWYIKR